MRKFSLAALFFAVTLCTSVHTAELKESFSYGINYCLLYTSPSPRDATLSRMPSSA